MWDNVRRTAELGSVSRHIFERDIVAGAAPCIMRGQVAKWPIVAAGARGAEALCDYLVAHANANPAQLWVGAPGSAGRFRYTDDISDVNFERKLVTIAQLCELLLRCRSTPNSPSLFAGAVFIPQHLPDLLRELPMPLLGQARERLTSLWIGNQSRTAAHWDLPQNLTCPIIGPRTFLLFPPEQIRNLYVGPIDFTLAGQPMSMVDCENPDFVRHPRFADALAAAQVAELAPGDTLYIPSLWFHYVLSPSSLGAQINFWWREKGADMLSPSATLLHALLTLRDLPDAERAAWRHFFDHYIFGDGHAAVAHIPMPARGVLGKLTPAIEQPLRQHLAKQLLG